MSTTQPDSNVCYQPVPCSPYVFEIRHWADGQPIDVVTDLDDAQEASATISPLPHLTEAIDPSLGLWNVWLPDYMTMMAWAHGLSILQFAAGYRLELDIDPA